MKLSPALLVLLLVVLLAGLYVGHSCGKPPSEFEVALDSLEVRLEQAVKDSTARAFAVDSLREIVSRDSSEKLSLRREASRLASVAARLRSRSTSEPEIVTDSERSFPLTDTSESEPQLTAAYDSLSSAYTLLLMVDSLNGVTIGALTRRISADSIYIESLEAVRAAGQRVVATKPGRQWLGCTIGPSALVGLDGRVSAGAGVSCGFRL